jgi:hypothetical protein
VNIVLQYESSALTAPQSFRDAMQAAANILDGAIYNNITVTILVGYGDFNNGQETNLTNVAYGDAEMGITVSYSALRAALADHESSSLDQTLLNSLPTGPFVNGVSSFWVPSGIAKALGLMSPAASGIDGAIGIAKSWPTDQLVSVALHEMTHALGRVPGSGTLDLLRYTSPGNHLFSNGNTAPPAYFSIDGGGFRTDFRSKRLPR